MEWDRDKSRSLFLTKAALGSKAQRGDHGSGYTIRPSSKSRDVFPQENAIVIAPQQQLAFAYRNLYNYVDSNTSYRNLYNYVDSNTSYRNLYNSVDSNTLPDERRVWLSDCILDEQ